MSVPAFLDNFALLAYAPNGVQKLRELIVQLAVRGKLITQNANDIPAKVLLDRIVDKRLSGLSPDSIEENIHLTLPAGWAWTTLTKVVRQGKNSIKRGPFGSTVRKDFFVPDGYKVYEQRNAIYNDFSLGAYFINEKKFNELREFAIKPNDIIISCSGTIGRLAIAPYGMKPGIMNQALLKITLENRILDNNYFLLLFPAFFMRTDTLTDLRGTAMKNIPAVKILKEIAFPLPPLEEQKRIVAKVDELMRLCDGLEVQQQAKRESRMRLNHAALAPLSNAALLAPEELEQATARLADNFATLYDSAETVGRLRSTTLKLAVQGKLVRQDPNEESASVLFERITKEKQRLIREKKIKTPQSFSPPRGNEVRSDLPLGWKWVRLNDVFDVRDGTHDTPKYVSDGFPLVTSKNLYTGLLDLSNVKYISESDHRQIAQRSRVDRNDVLFAMIGSIGNPVIVDIDREFSIKNVALFKYFSSDLSEPDYLRYFLIAASAQMREESAGGVQSFVSLTFLRKYLFPLPPLAEQKRIVAKVNQLMTLCDELEAKLRQAEADSEKLISAAVQHVIESIVPKRTSDVAVAFT